MLKRILATKKNEIEVRQKTIFSKISFFTFLYIIKVLSKNNNDIIDIAK